MLHFHFSYWSWCNSHVLSVPRVSPGVGITCSIFSGRQSLWDAPFSPQTSTLCPVHCGDSAQAECSDRAAGSAALTCPSSCSTVSLLGENYRFSSQRGFILISHAFLSYSCRLLVPWGKCSQHTTSHCSLWLMEPWVPQIPPSPILLLWCIYLSRPGNVIRGNRSQDASPTSGSWQKVWTQHSWIPQLSHTLWKPCSTSIVPRGHSASRGVHLQCQLERTAVLFNILQEESPPLAINHWHFHFSLPISSKSLTRIFSSLCVCFLSFKAGLDSWRLSQSWFFGWLFLFLREAFRPYWDDLLH